MSASRRYRIRTLVRQSGFSTLDDLVRALTVSESTIRRDLDQLEQSGDVRRVHGGVFWTGESSTIAAFEDRTDSTWTAKAQIGKAAAELIQDGDTVLLDGGSTTYELARRLVGRRLQVVTNSLPVAHLLSSSDTIDLVIIGGCVRGRTAVAIGPLSETMLRHINVSIAFLSVAGVNQRGYYNDNMMLAESEKAMLRSAERTYVVADRSKFGKVSLSQICSLDAVDGLVTDHLTDKVWQDRLIEAKVELVLADSDPHLL